MMFFMLKIEVDFNMDGLNKITVLHRVAMKRKDQLTTVF